MDGVDNYTYTDNLTVSLDNLTSWVFDNGSGIDHTAGNYFLSDNSAFTPAYNTTGWQTDNLSLQLVTINSSGESLG